MAVAQQPAPCTAAGLVDGCFSQENLSAKQQKAVIVYAMVLALQALGGTDYRSTLTGATAAGGLVYDAAQVFQTMNQGQRDNALVNIWINLAIAAGASSPESVNAALTDIQCLTCAKDDQLEQMYLWLLCNLAAEQAPIIL